MTIDEIMAGLRASFEARNEGLADQISIRDGIVFRVAPSARYGFEFFCWRSPEMAKELDVFVEFARGRERLLDVGAFHGLFSLVFTALHGQRMALAVEPSPAPFDILRHHKRLNDDLLILPEFVALSDKAGDLRMKMEWEHVVVVESDPQMSLPCETGDSLCQRHKFAPDIIKIDVEGHEMRVLEGLSGMILAHRPVIMLELHPSHLHLSESHIEDLRRIADAHALRVCSLGMERFDGFDYAGESHVVLIPE